MSSVLRILLRAVILLSLASVTSHSQPQGPEEAFTERDLYVTLRVLLPDEGEAARVARAMFGSGEGSESARGPETSGGWVISDEILAVMSLLSDELRDKVERYRRNFPDSQGQEQQARWTALRAQMKAWLDAQPPRRLPPEYDFGRA